MSNRLTVISVLVLGCLVAALPVSAGEVDDYKAMVQAWEAAYNTGDADAVAAFYTEDGMRMPPNQPAVEGRAGITGQIRQGMEMGLAKVSLESLEAQISGDLAWQRGTYAVMAADGSALDNGKWMQVAKKIDGKWYAYRDIWNSDNPLPEADE